MTTMALKTSLSLFAIFQTLDDDIPLAICRKFGKFSRVELMRRVSRILPTLRVFILGYANTLDVKLFYCLYGVRLAVYSLFPVNPLLSSPFK